MPKVPKARRQEIARTRLLRILQTHGIANWRTLEQKISDAGPGPQRVDPHILTPVRNELEDEGLIHRRLIRGTPWFTRPDTPEEFIQARLAVQQPTWEAIQTDNFRKRMGQTLEIAIYRALLAQDDMPDFLGSFLDLNAHNDSTLYSKEEPPRRLGSRNIEGDRRLDFLIRHPESGWAGLEAKNIREWMYPNRPEIFELLSKCLALNVVPILVARRIHFSTFIVLNTCGVIIHQTYNQLFPLFDAELAAAAQNKNSLGYHDIRARNFPDDRLTKFISTHLPAVLPEHRAKFDAYKDLISAYTENEMPYSEFAARVRRRNAGANEDHDWEDNEEPDPSY
jgi:hypothetical protein